MDDPKPLPSSSDAPDPARLPEEEGVLPLRPEGRSVAPDADEVIESGVPAPFSSEPVRVPEYDARSGRLVGMNEPEPARVEAPPPETHLPGDAHAEEIPLSAPVGDVPLPPPGTVMIEEPGDVAGSMEAEAAARAPRQGAFTLWAIVWIAAWAGGMFLLLNHRFERTFDWNTSYFSVAARNLVRDGFVPSHGGVYLTAGDFREYRHDSFYAGHPPLTAWLLAGWMRALGDHDRAIRALPLTFSVLNLLLLYALVRRVFGAPAALATTVVCSLLPMTAYYAQVVNMEPFVLTFMLGASLGYLGWARSSSRVGFVLLLLCVILGCWTDWPMYVFTGFLAVMHFVRRRDGLIVGTPEGGETVERAGRPVLSTLFLLLLPVAVFGVYFAYLKWNGAGLSDLLDRAKERTTAGGTWVGGLHLLADRLKDRHELKPWFVDLFTPAALLLAVVGAVLWSKWTRRLSLASGEAARRAAFRVVVAMVLTQVVYTLAFPEGAHKHEFWQYYLAVPVAVLVAGLCTWLTVAGGIGRRFHWGLADRAAWSVAALIPLLAVGPFAYRMHLRLPGKDAPKEDANVRREFVDALRGATDERDVILTDWNQDKLGFGVQWYADRAILPYEGPDQDTHTIEGIDKLRAKYKDRRILYLWGDGDGSERLFETLNKHFRSKAAGPVMLYVIQEPGAAAPVPSGGATTSPAAAATTAPATAPSTSTTTRPTP